MTSAAASLDEGHFEEALSSADSAIGVSPERYRAYYVRGSIHEAMHRYEPAFEDFDTAERLYSETDDGLNPKLIQGAMSIAKIGVRIKQMRFDEARALIAQFSAKNGRWPLSDLYEGLVDLALGDVQRARTTFRRTPDSPWWREHSACAFATYLLGDRDEAMRLAAAALDELRNQHNGVQDARCADIEVSILAMKQCIASGDRRCAIESFQRAEEFAVFPKALVDEWTK